MSRGLTSERVSASSAGALHGVERQTLRFLIGASTEPRRRRGDEVVNRELRAGDDPDERDSAQDPDLVEVSRKA